MSNYPTINYIGNKTKIVEWIISLFPKDCKKVVDLFSGGCSVAYAMKEHGYEVTTNDVLFSNYCISKGIIENNTIVLEKDDYKKVRISQEKIDEKVEELKFLSNVIYFDYEIPELARLILVSERLTGNKKYLFLSLLRRAMIRKIPYSRMNVAWKEIVKLRDEDYSYKKYGRYRAYHNKTFESHIDEYLDEYNKSIFDNGEKHKSYQKDVLDFCRSMGKVDMVYLDPPYPSTMNKYNSFYGFFDDMFNKRISMQLDLTSKLTFIDNFEKIIKILKNKTNYIAVSLNSRSKPSAEDLIEMLNKYSSNIEEFNTKHNYKVTGKENKNSNYEILIVATMKKASL